MQIHSLQNEETPAISRVPFATTCVGRMIGLTVDRRPLVDFSGNVQGAVEARLGAFANLPEEWGEDGLPVVLMFENGDLGLPIIVGFVQDRFPKPLRETPVVPSPWFVEADGKTVVLEAQNQIVLRCGRSSVTLRKDGRLVMQGTDVVSRASNRNRIKGGSVAIN